MARRHGGGGWGRSAGTARRRLPRPGPGPTWGGAAAQRVQLGERRALAADALRPCRASRTASARVSGPTSIRARQRPGRTTAGCSRSRSSLVVTPTRTLRPWPSRPSVRLSSRDSAWPAVCLASPRISSSQSSRSSSRQRPFAGAVVLADRDVHQIADVVEQPLRVEHAVHLAPVAPGAGQRAQRGGLAGAGRAVQQQQPARDVLRGHLHQPVHRVGHRRGVVGADLLPGARPRSARVVRCGPRRGETYQKPIGDVLRLRLRLVLRAVRRPGPSTFSASSSVTAVTVTSAPRFQRETSSVQPSPSASVALRSSSRADAQHRGARRQQGRPRLAPGRWTRLRAYGCSPVAKRPRNSASTTSDGESLSSMVEPDRKGRRAGWRTWPP